MSDKTNKWKKLPWQLGIATVILGMLCMTTIKNIVDEPYSSFLGIAILMLMWMVVPSSAVGLRILRYFLNDDGPSLFDWLVLAYLFALSPIYFYYALNGPTDPDTAAHMHLVLVPIGLAILSIPLLCFLFGDMLVGLIANLGGDRQRTRRGKM